MNVRLTMNFCNAISKLSEVKCRQLAKKYATELGLQWDKEIKHVFNAVLRNKDLAPKRVKGSDEQIVIRKWVEEYKRGYEGRISKRKSKLPGTLSDPLVNKIINKKLPKLKSKQLLQIQDAHRLSMSAENILGHLLEEYLALKLRPHGWYCAWGATVSNVDFCNKKGILLQVKNRSNSENAPSSSVRKGTAIKKWHRINAQTCEEYWGQLTIMLNIKCKLTQGDFERFVLKTIEKNPDAMPIENGNYWGNSK